MNNTQILTPDELLQHWQGHRNLTRRVIETFPEPAFQTHSIGGMRPFAKIVQELLAIAVPGLRQLVGGATEPLKEQDDSLKTKADYLVKWDEATEEINRLWQQLPPEKFQEKTVTFGQYEGTVWSSLFYFIDNEIHHRGQAYTYLRSLGIEPPYFWER